MIRLSILLILFSFISTCLAGTANYSFKDLEILYNRQSFDEFLEHARDVVPSERNGKWEIMVQEMATELVNRSISAQKFSQEDLKKIEALSEWAPLNGADRFQSRRAEFGKQLFTKIVSEQSTEFLPSLENFWNNTPNSDLKTDLGLSLGELLLTKNVPTNIWPYFSAAAHHSNAKIFCKNDFLLQAMILELNNLSFIDMSDKKALSEALTNIGFLECWKTAKQSLLEYSTSASAVHKEIILTALNHLNLLSQDEYDYHLVLYLLEGPLVGPLFNYAWSRVIYLGESNTDRTNLLNKIKKLSLLPDKLFATPDLKKRSTVINFLQENFPEYFEWYEKSCINYIQGIGEYPQGNPTLNCSHYFDTIKSEKWINQQRYKTYINSKTLKSTTKP